MGLKILICNWKDLEVSKVQNGRKYQGSPQASHQGILPYRTPWKHIRNSVNYVQMMETDYSPLLLLSLSERENLLSCFLSQALRLEVTQDCPLKWADDTKIALILFILELFLISVLSPRPHTHSHISTDLFKIMHRRAVILNTICLYLLSSGNSGVFLSASISESDSWSMLSNWYSQLIAQYNLCCNHIFLIVIMESSKVNYFINLVKSCASQQNQNGR